MEVRSSVPLGSSETHSKGFLWFSLSCFFDFPKDAIEFGHDRKSLQCSTETSVYGIKCYIQASLLT